METDNPTNISSEDFQMLEEVLNKLRSKHKLYPEHPKQEQFYKLSFFRGKFRTTKVLEILLDDEPMDSPFKCVLAAGLCGWVFDPTENIFAEHLMYLETERILGEYIAIADENVFENEETKEIFGKHILIGDNFHKDIRFPLAGPSPFECFVSGIDLEENFLGELKSINAVNYCLLLLHTIGEQYDAEKHLSPSWNIVRQFADYKRQKPSEETNEIAFVSEYAETRLRDGWKKYMRSFSMIYTANYIKISDDLTLLEMIVSAQIDTRALLKCLPEWLEKAAYYHANHLKPLKNTYRSDVGNWIAKKVKHKPFRPVSIGEMDNDLIMDIMKKGMDSMPKR